MTIWHYFLRDMHDIWADPEGRAALLLCLGGLHIPIGIAIHAWFKKQRELNKKQSLRPLR
jgi:hypothetical protein